MKLRKICSLVLTALLLHSGAGPVLAQVQAVRTAAPGSSIQIVPVVAAPGAGLQLTNGVPTELRMGMSLPGTVLPTPLKTAPGAAVLRSPVPNFRTTSVRDGSDLRIVEVRPVQAEAPANAAAPRTIRASIADVQALAQSPAAKTPESAAQALISAETIAAQTLRPEAAAETSSVELSRFYHSARPRTASDAVVEASDSAAPRPSGLERSSAREETASEPAAPVRSLSRAAKYGYVASILGTIMTFGAQMAAAALGYAPHSNYQPPALPSTPGLFDAASLVMLVSVFAPIVEELMFRAGLLGGLEWLAKKVNGRWAGVAASVIASAVFVVLHETSDPLLIGIRMADALLMAWVYKREGLMASIIQHAVHNGLLAAGMIAGMFLGAFSAPAMFAFAAANLALTFLFGRDLLAQRADRREGRIARHELTPWTARALSALLALSALFSLGGLAQLALMFAAGLLLYSFLKPKDLDELGRL